MPDPELAGPQEENSPLAGLCAVESKETHWQIRLDGGNEEIRAKLVSAN